MVLKWIRNHGHIPAKTIYDILGPISNEVNENSSFRPIYAREYRKKASRQPLLYTFSRFIHSPQRAGCDRHKRMKFARGRFCSGIGPRPHFTLVGLWLM
jgi:hypothetical protein